MFWKKKNTVSEPEKAGAEALELRLKAIEQRIEDKMSLLQVLEEKASQKIETLEKLLYAAPYAPHEPGTGASGRRGNRTDEILALSGKGLDAAEIARILAVPAGEVELILDLNRK